MRNNKRSVQIPKRISKAVNLRTDNTIEWLKEQRRKDKQWSTKYYTEGLGLWYLTTLRKPLTSQNWLSPATVYSSPYYKPGKRAIMYLCVRGIDFASFHDFSIWVWNCSNNVVFLIFVSLIPILLWNEYVFPLFKAHVVIVDFPWEYN